MVKQEVILELINLRQEGGYWDFKKEWYKSDNKGKQDLLHDIICMSNNLDSRDAFIIIGVNEDDNYNLRDVSEDNGRKNTQNIVDFLKDKKFAGGLRPTVYVKSYQISGKTIDVIVILNDNNTPYYLTDNFQGIRANYIYTRIQDTNTPIDRSADIDKVEFLWRKRLGLTQTVLERFEIYLEDYENWNDGPYGEMQKYYKYFPEFTIEYMSAKDGRDGYEYYLFSQTDSSPHWYDIQFKYHQTLLKELLGVALDGGRYFTPCPEIAGITLDKTKNYNWDFSYRYFTKGTFKYKLNEFFYLQESFSEEYSRMDFFEVVLLFETENERMEFEKFVRRNWDKRDMYLNNVYMPHIPNLPNYKEGAFIEEYENALVLNKMLSEFRNNQN
ncbi:MULTISPECIES: helix-turn-helix domain-containing protein [Streptococcus]|uniref:AlbA family DNA-binding domain-containing protein n=1 Tax=Streptococcus TaxID=1301 RepID=UPI000CF587B8|nr:MULTISPECIES: RNA-binding domain-containing protein [Streptococcus]MBS8023896.1 ATP-binding protein [Streptococcus suis]MBS8081915.1 ATP-binding protein [Streptococcus suis]MBS8083615.1 ATP-binding protein [Streptococcus suis]MBS8112019.1 ATP-binding protein [Streptococcus suis]MBY4973194.1 ATP-binding protein [Streptococcus suis]